MTLGGILCIAVLILVVAYNDARPQPQEEGSRVQIKGETRVYRVTGKGVTRVYRVTGAGGTRTYRVTGGGTRTYRFTGGAKPPGGGGRPPAGARQPPAKTKPPKAPKEAKPPKTPKAPKGSGEKKGKYDYGVCTVDKKYYGIVERTIEHARRLSAGTSILTGEILTATHLLGKKLPDNIVHALLILLCDTEKGLFKVLATVGTADSTVATAFEKLLEVKDLSTLTDAAKDALESLVTLTKQIAQGSVTLSEDAIFAVRDTLVVLAGQDPPAQKDEGSKSKSKNKKKSK